VVWQRATGSDHFIVKFPGQWQVGKAVAMHVTHFLSAISVFGAAKTVWQRLHAGPRCDRVPDQIAGSTHSC
jgi:hypothetical protein